MKRVTFLIGNGFDINLGLNTKYKEFYPFYFDQCHTHKLANEIQKDYEKWADLEIGLGKYTKKVSVSEMDDFLEEEEQLELMLTEYLEKECQRVKIEDPALKEKIAIQMQDYLMNFYKGLNTEQRIYIRKLFTTTREPIHYSFINFNYTNTLEKILEVTKEVVTGNFGTHKSDTGVNYANSIGLHIHIHGTTSEEMVVGVNDETQIANKELCKSNLFKELLLKPEANKRYGQNKTATAKRIIDESIIIGIFGMSIGETDKMWWEYLCKWLSVNPDRRLIIYVKKEDTFRRTKRSLFSSENAVLEEMMQYAMELGETWNVVRNQIYIEFNSDIFTFEKMV